jgi:blue copper oxidase
MRNEPMTFRNRPLSRRQFLVYGGIGATVFGISACTAPTGVPPTLAAPIAVMPTATAQPATAELAFKLTARTTELPILPGNTTSVLSYASEVLQGDPAAVTAVPGSYLGPIVRLTRGQTVRVHVRNELDEATNVHWHGLIVPTEADGHPSAVVAPGAETVYEFEVRNRPGAYWFHPHPHGRTAEQAYGGLAGMVIVTDAEEAALGLPAGDRDIPLIIQDRRFDSDNQLVYIASGMAGMSDEMMGLLGDHILVNGQLGVMLPVATQPYRLRLLNGSNARIYKLAWSNGAPLTVIGTDGGLLTAPTTAPYVMLSPGERIELWADFSQEVVGNQIKLVSLAYEGVEAGGMAMGEPALPNGAPFDIMTFNVAEAVGSSDVLPAQLLPVEVLSAAMASNAASPRRFVLAMDDAMNWTINGRRYEMDVVADDEKVRLGETEVWEFINQMDAPAVTGGGAMAGMGNMAGMDHSAHAQQGASNDNSTSAGSVATNAMRDFMAHPIHLHGVQFQVLERQVDDAQRAGWETVKDGLVDQGWKDTVLVMPGERVRVVMRFDGYRGVYLIHCHNLEHEDSGMMRNFEIV